MAANVTQRPANRPSRRNDIVTAAADLLATDAPELVSIADIARHAGLTSAAIYYHFRSRDELVDEIVSTVSAQWSAVVTQALADLTSRQELAELTDTLFDWIEAHPRWAMVYFVSSVGVTLQSEVLRREARYSLSREVSSTMQRLGNETTPVDLTVRALGIVTLLEVGAADQLRSSLSFRAPGKVKFRETLTEMMHKLFP